MLAPIRSLGRMYWLVTGILVAAGLAGFDWGIPAAIALTAIQCVHFAAMGHGVASLPGQVRAAYLLLLVVGLWPPLAFVHVLQCVGTWASVLVDYCPLARLMSLLPWHRAEPLSWATVRWTLFAPPGPGSIAERRTAALRQRAAKQPRRPADAVPYLPKPRRTQAPSQPAA